MKKLLSLLLVLALMLSLPVAAMAESTKLLSWVTVHRVIEKNAISGSFYQIGHMDLDIWVPELLSPQKDIPQDCFCVFANKDKSASVTVRAEQSKSRSFLCKRETHRQTIFFLPCTFQWVRWKTSPQ